MPILFSMVLTKVYFININVCKTTLLELSLNEVKGNQSATCLRSYIGFLLKKRIIFKLLTFIYKILNGLAPECFATFISVRDNDKCLLHNVYLNSSYGRRSFTYTAPRFWNALPFKIRSCVSLDIFKRLTKNYLFKSDAFIYN